ncbi:MAG: SOS response-associated peptidase [Oleispira sp.]|nr:SOS response-associated peptidase [Oleispira sp.]
MCGRFNLAITPKQVRYLDALGSPFPFREQPQLNIAPTETVPMLINQQQDRQSAPEPVWTKGRWWLVPSWSDGPNSKFSMFNARSETLNSSRAFKKPYQAQRCIIPASSYIEWKKVTGGKRPIELSYPQQPMFFAGIWDIWQGALGNENLGNESLVSCAIVTADAHPSIADIHDRMPVMLDSADAKTWLSHHSREAELQRFFTKLPQGIESRNVEPESNSTSSENSLF